MVKSSLIEILIFSTVSGITDPNANVVYFFVSVFGGFLILAFMLSVTIILLNILIAQLSLTYETVQEESQHSFTAMRMQAVAIVEWGSRFRFWVS